MDYQKYNNKQTSEAQSTVLNAEKVKSARCVFIHGTDAFQRDTYFKQVMKILGVSLNDEASSYMFYGDDFPRDEKIFSIMDTLNMMSFDLSEKIVSIRHFESLNKEAINRIAKYCENPFEYSKLIIVSDKLDGRLGALKTIEKHSLCLETKEIKYTKDLMQWLNNYIRENKIQMDEATKNYFVNTVHLDAYTAYNELKKLELYIGNNKTITINDIKECTINSKVYAIFDLTDAIGYRQRDKSLQIVDNLVSNEESIIMIVASLTNFFFTLWRLDALRRKGISAHDMKASHMKEINPYFKDKYITFLKNYNQEQITKAFKQLYICDSRAKLSMGKDEILGMSLVMGIMN